MTPPTSACADVLVLGGGPAGTALAAELAALGLDVRQVAPHPPRPFPATYGTWLDELPAPARACAAQVWTDVRVYSGAAPTPLLRPYALLDNAALLHALRGRADWRWTVGAALGVGRAGNGGWVVRGTRGERWSARLVVDAGGHGGVLRPLHFAGGAALQTAYGVVARFARPPISPGSLSWMDYRTPAPELRRGGATFLYAMHLGADRFFVEETSLIARPAPTRAELRARLLARLRAQGTPPLSIESEEWVAFPMNAAAPSPSPILAYGAAAGRVHPVSGFQVAGALADAPGVAQAVADALAAGTDAAAAGWDALWPPERRAARQVQLLGVEALLRLEREEVPPFFGAFFGLLPADWSRFLAQGTPAEELARIMLRLFAQAPGRVRRRLMEAALGQPRLGAAALGAVLHSRAAPRHNIPRQ